MGASFTPVHSNPICPWQCHSYSSTTSRVSQRFDRVSSFLLWIRRRAVFNWVSLRQNQSIHLANNKGEKPRKEFPFVYVKYGLRLSLLLAMLPSDNCLPWQKKNCTNLTLQCLFLVLQIKMLFGKHPSAFLACSDETKRFEVTRAAT